MKYLNKDIFIIPVITIAIILMALYTNMTIESISKASLSELPTTEHFTERLSDPDNSLTKKELIGYANELLTLTKKSRLEEIERLQSTKYSLLFVLACLIFWLFKSFQLLNKQSSNK